MHLERSGTSSSQGSGLGRSNPLRRSSGRWGNDNNDDYEVENYDDGHEDQGGNHWKK